MLERVLKRRRALKEHLVEGKGLEELCPVGTYLHRRCIDSFKFEFLFFSPLLVVDVDLGSLLLIISSVPGSEPAGGVLCASGGDNVEETLNVRNAQGKVRQAPH